MQIPEDEDLSVGLAISSSKRPSQMAMLKDYCGILASADNPTPAGKATSFISLNGSKIQVEFEIVTNRLRRRILEAVTRERHGDDGVRIVSLLLNTGKMDEKQMLEEKKAKKIEVFANPKGIPASAATIQGVS